MRWWMTPSIRAGVRSSARATTAFGRAIRVVQPDLQLLAFRDADRRQRPPARCPRPARRGRPGSDAGRLLRHRESPLVVSSAGLPFSSQSLRAMRSRCSYLNMSKRCTRFRKGPPREQIARIWAAKRSVLCGSGSAGPVQEPCGGQTRVCLWADDAAVRKRPRRAARAPRVRRGTRCDQRCSRVQPGTSGGAGECPACGIGPAPGASGPRSLSERALEDRHDIGGPVGPDPGPGTDGRRGPSAGPTTACPGPCGFSRPRSIPKTNVPSDPAARRRAFVSTRRAPCPQTARPAPGPAPGAGFDVERQLTAQFGARREVHRHGFPGQQVHGDGIRAERIEHERARYRAAGRRYERQPCVAEPHSARPQGTRSAQGEDSAVAGDTLNGGIDLVERPLLPRRA